MSLLPEDQENPIFREPPFIDNEVFSDWMVHGSNPDRDLYSEWRASMKGIDQTYQEWLESELKVARKFQAAWEQEQIRKVKHVE